MSTIERPGINSKWLKRMKTWHRGIMEDWWKTYDPDTKEDLEYYVQHGVSSIELRYPAPRKPVAENSKASKTFLCWTNYIRDSLALYSWVHEFELERFATTEKRLDLALSVSTFAAFHLSEMIGLSSDNNGFNIDKTSFVALGIVLGCEEQGFALARRRIAYFRELLKHEAIDEAHDVYGVIRLKRHHAIFHFMMRLWADYLNEVPHLPVGKANEEPILLELLERWRDPSPEALAPVCLAACDFHTHRCWDEDDDEFVSSHFMYIPIEILLLFKLRQFLGLQNPALEHPIMNPPFDILPANVAFEPDDLIRRVRERMIQDGYDEAKILARYETNVDARMPRT